MTTKKLHLRSIIGELLWFLRGDTNVRWLQERGISIWDEWADAQRRPRPGLRLPVALVADARRPAASTRSPRSSSQIRTNPDSRRHIVSAWNVADVDDMALPPCHTMFQFYVSPPAPTAGAGSPASSTSASADIFLGVPFNIASYALLTRWSRRLTDLEPGEFVHTLGDAHLYLNHLDQARLQLTRDAAPAAADADHARQDDIDEFDLDDFELVGYDAAPGDQGADRRLSRATVWARLWRHD